MRTDSTKRRLKTSLVLVLLCGLGGIAVGLGGVAIEVLFRTSFTNAAPEFGSFEEFTEEGFDFSTVAPVSGIVNGEYVLTDLGGNSAVDIGVECFVGKTSNKATLIQFDLTLNDPETRANFEITDTSGIDFGIQVALTGDGDGGGAGGTDICSYHVSLLLYPSPVGQDLFVLTVSELDCGEQVVTIVDPIPGGFQPVGGLRVTKLGGSTGALTLDNIEIKQVQ